MTLHLDTSRAFRSPTSRRRLLEAVYKASPHDETQWLEWKSRVDLADKRWRFEVARHILGFANRDPARAARLAEGCAFILLGMEPGNVFGLKQHDPADVESWITPYTGETDGPQWDIHYHEFQGLTVLMVTIEPPTQGQKMFVLRRSFGSFQEGTVFVRRLGKTEQASASDMDLLIARGMMLRDKSLDVTLDWWDQQVEIIPLDLSETALMEGRQHLKRRLLQRVVWPPPLEELLEGAVAGQHPSNKFVQEVDVYLDALSPSLGRYLHREMVSRQLNELTLGLVNQTDRNFSQVEVELRFDAKVWAYFESRDAAPREGFPTPPRPPGLLGLSDQLATVSNIGFFDQSRARGSTENVNSTRILFPEVDLRPQYRRALLPVFIVADASLSGKAVAGEWWATSTGASGVATGQFTMAVSNATMHPATLLDLPLPEV